MEPSPESNDADNDGSDNHTEWLLGFAPDQFASRLRYAASISENELLIQFDEPEPDGIDYVVETSVDFKEWTDGLAWRVEQGEDPPLYRIEMGEGVFARVSATASP